MYVCELSLIVCTCTLNSYSNVEANKIECDDFRSKRIRPKQKNGRKITNIWPRCAQKEQVKKRKRTEIKLFFSYLKVLDFFFCSLRKWTKKRRISVCYAHCAHYKQSFVWKNVFRNQNNRYIVSTFPRNGNSCDFYRLVSAIKIKKHQVSAYTYDGSLKSDCVESIIVNKLSGL